MNAHVPPFGRLPLPQGASGRIRDGGAFARAQIDPNDDRLLLRSRATRGIRALRPGARRLSACRWRRMPRRVDPSPRCLVLAAWPARDRTAFDAALRPGDIFEDGGGAAHWSQRTVAKVCAATAAGSVGLRAASARSLNRPGTSGKPRAPEALSRRCRASQRTLHGLLPRPGTAHDPARDGADIDWTWLGRIEAALRARATPSRNKRARLKPAGELEALGRRLMAKAEAILNAPLKRAVGYRDGLMIALLARRPLRLRTSRHS